MSTKKLTIQTETAQRSSDQIQVLSSGQINQKITPSQIRMANAKYIILEDTAGNADAYLTRDASDNLIIANLGTGNDIDITVTMSSGNQRVLILREYGASNNLEMAFLYDTIISTESGDIILEPTDAFLLPTLPTSDPTNADEVFNELGTLRLSDGTEEVGYCFASIHNSDTLTAQSIATGTTYTKLTNYTDNGLSLNCTAAAASDKITITKTGYYAVSRSFNFFCGTNNVTWRIAPFLDGTEQDEIHIMRKIGTASDIGSALFVGS